MVDVAVLIAQGVDAAGKRQILGVTIGLGEAEIFWRTFLQSLIQRGLCGVRLITSDAHARPAARSAASVPAAGITARIPDTTSQSRTFS
ncbi:MAG: hypothetical protein Fur0043_26110 [Anaerolineales bacterium]